MTRQRTIVAIALAVSFAMVAATALPVAASTGLAVNAPDKTTEPEGTVTIPVEITNSGEERFTVGMELFPSENLRIEEVDGDGTFYPDKDTVIYLSALDPGDSFETTVEVSVPDATGTSHNLTVSVLPAEGDRVNDTATVTVPPEATPTPKRTVSVLGFDFEMPELPDFLDGWFS